MKKIQLLAIFFILLLANTFAQNKKGQITISNGTLKIDNYVFNAPWPLKTFTSSLGDADRIDPEGSGLYTYDERGVMLYVNSTSQEVTDFNVYFGKDPNEPYDWVPTGLAKQPVLVEKFKITANTSLAKLKAGLPKYNFVKSSIGAYRGILNGLYIYVQFDAEDKKVYWISVGIED